jgi:hypothetical protein
MPRSSTTLWKVGASSNLLNASSSVRRRSSTFSMVSWRRSSRLAVVSCRIASISCESCSTDESISWESCSTEERVSCSCRRTSRSPRSSIDWIQYSGPKSTRAAPMSSHTCGA